MTEVWITIGVLAVLTFAIKAAPAPWVGGRELSAPAVGVISLLAPAVLSALIVVGTFADGRDLVLDARAAGLAAGAVAIAFRAAGWSCWWPRRPRRWRGRWGRPGAPRCGLAADASPGA